MDEYEKTVNQYNDYKDRISEGDLTVIADTLTLIDKHVELSFVDDIQNPYDEYDEPEVNVIIAIGNNEVRKRIVPKVKHNFVTIIHPTAYVSPTVSIGEGSVVLANAVIQANAVVGKHCIINANVTIDHDATIEDYVSIYPGAYIGGGAKITESKTVEPNAVVARNTIF